MSNSIKVKVIGAGLAGSEASFQLAERSINVELYEMKPLKYTEAHKSPNFAELLCSNSFKSTELTKASGILKRELIELNSLIMESALTNQVPAGKALAVDRDKFSQYITQKLKSHPNVQILNEEVIDFDVTSYTIIASGPLTSLNLSTKISNLIGEPYLYFYDAIAPIVTLESLDLSKMFYGSRNTQDLSNADYLNVPLTENEYYDFIKDLRGANTVETRDFENIIHFEGCLPIEEMAKRGEETLAFGPLKPVGLKNPNFKEKAKAIIQLRKENLEGSSFNLVGFQTKMTYEEQKRVFRKLPGFENAEFERLGSMHRNTYINSPQILNSHGNMKKFPKIFFAGQITGVEGYLESSASGLLTGIIIANLINKEKFIDLPPQNTALGALYNHIKKTQTPFVPSNINFSLFDLTSLSEKLHRNNKKIAIAELAQKEFQRWKETL